MLRYKESKTYPMNTGLKKIGDFLYGRLEYKHAVCFVIYFAIISILELTAYSGTSEAVTWLTARIWLITTAVGFLFMLIYLGSTMQSLLLRRDVISLIGIVGIVIYLIWICIDINRSDVSPDAAQQVAAGLKSFQVSDFNYTGKAFLGYPNRQYILVAVPAFLFGRSITTLHMGFALLFILGVLMMYCGLREWFIKNEIPECYSLIAVYAIFAFRFVTEYYINFEQAILPISLTMIIIGLFLRLLVKPDATGVFCIAFIGDLCSNSYTPSLAVLGLMVLAVGLLAAAIIFVPGLLPSPVQNKKQVSGILIAADINIILFFVATLLGQRSDRVTKLREGIQLKSVVMKSIGDFMTDKNAVFMGFMGILVFIYLIASLTLRLKTYDFLLSLWVIGVFAVTNLMEGYTNYDVAAIMQRALIVIPVLITGMILTCGDLVKKYNLRLKNDLFIVILIAFALIGKHNFAQPNQSFIYFNYVQPMKYMLVDLEKTTDEQHIRHTDRFNYIIYTDNICMTNPGDYFQFLYPGAKVYIGEKGFFPPGIDKTIPTIIYGDYDISGMTPSGDMEIIPYENKRYDEVGYWYKICIYND